MKKTISLVVILAIGLLMISNSILVVQENNNSVKSEDIINIENSKSDKYTKSQTISYTIHDRITISDWTFDTYIENVSNGGGLGTEEEPYIIENYNITLDNSYDIGIKITLSNKSFLIRNCWIKNGKNGIYVGSQSGSIEIVNNTIIGGHTGIYIKNTNNTKIINNTCSGMDYYGIEAEDSEYTLIKDNTCIENAERGIYLLDSDSSTVSTNFCSMNEDGIQSTSSDFVIISNNVADSNYENGILAHGNNVEIKENLCMKNSVWNIRASSSENVLIYNNTGINGGTGLYLTSINNTQVINNNFSNNNWRGINLFNYINDEESWGCFNNKIVGNFVFNNTKASIIVTLFSQDNKIFSNHFLNNGPALDNGDNNTWYDSLTNKGNYWDNYAFTGYYSITGDANAKDHYPISYSPQSNSPTDIVIESKTDNPVITWLAIDDNPSYYSVYVNGSEIVSDQSWLTNKPIEITIESLKKGVYNYTIVLVDDDGHSIKDAVFITITKNLEAVGFIQTTTILGLLLIGFIAKIKRRKEE